MMFGKPEINHEQFTEIASRIQFYEADCTDSICCFQPPNIEGVNVNPIGDNWDFLLLIGNILSPYPEAHHKIKDLIKHPDFKIRYFAYPADSWLAPRFSLENNNLAISTRCSRYNERPQMCRDYTICGGCDFKKYCRKPRELREIGSTPAIMFYGLEEKLSRKIISEQQIELSPFFTGRYHKLSLPFKIRSYNLIPIPNKTAKISSRIQIVTTQSS